MDVFTISKNEVLKMKRMIILILMMLNCFLAFAKDSNGQTADVLGKDFYFAYLAFKDYSSQPKIIFRQDKDRVNERIEYLKSLSKKYDSSLPEKSFQELIQMPPEERYDYLRMKEFESVSEEDYRSHSFCDINEYKFRIKYNEQTVEVYMFIDRPSVRDGDAEYIFDYDGNIISKKYGG